ncbi:MAG: hypothetical protein LBK67_06640 [Coriobacteriales bacterium]|jgi:hypothetical protein|nr:hypothetical protein [Coriobacteriales bacterium]
MARQPDRERVIWLLQAQGTTSNQRVRTALDLTDERYQKVKSELIEQSLLERVKGQGGGIQLTDKGWKYGALLESQSAVSKELDLYPHFVRLLRDESRENDEPAVIIDTSAMRKSGKWVNPDIIKITLKRLPLLRTHKFIVTTYELKQWKKWGLQAVYEAASQRRFAHQSNLVVEWAHDAEIVLPDQVINDCSRFGVGLLTMRPYYKSFRYFSELESKTHSPSDDAVEEFLTYVFAKYPEAEAEFQALWKQDV